MKAVIPAAGVGTRMLPVTKVVPKELIPVGTKPALQWVIEEAVDAGLQDLVIVVNERKRLLREYLTPLDRGDPLSDYETMLELERLLRRVEITFVIQPAPLGLSDAILRCRECIGSEPFALLLPDNVFLSARSPVTSRLVRLHARTGQSCIALWRARGAGLSDGAVIGTCNADSTWSVSGVLRKGDVRGRATDLRPLGRAVLEPRAFDFLQSAVPSGERDEVAALNSLAQERRLIGLLVEEELVHIGAEVDEGVLAR